MPEQETGGIKRTLTGWVKAIITSVLGLISGAFIMYLTPVVNNAIKPAKPVANFATESEGLTVTFNNRSTGAVQGWWDFGDGSALEPFDPKTESIKHTYTKAGTYSAKLTLQNLLGEPSDRTATVSPDLTTAPKPAIAQFELVPITPGERAPAVYRLQTKVSGASFCILSAGDNRPTEIIDDANLERYLTFKEMGMYTVRLAAVNGKQLIEKTQDIYVAADDGTDPLVKLLVTYEAVRVDRYRKNLHINCGWQGDLNASTVPFRKERSAEIGCTIASAEFANKDAANPLVRNVKLEIAADKRKVIVSGELVRPTEALVPGQMAPHWLAEVKAVVERRSRPQTISRGDVMMTAKLNNTTTIPLQPLEAGWEILSKKVSVELWDGGHKVWEGASGVSNAPVTMNKKVCYATVVPQNDSVLVTVKAPTAPTVTKEVVVPAVPAPRTEPVGPVIRRTGFEYNPLLPRKLKDR